MGTACYLLVSNRDELAAAEGVPFITLLPSVPVVFFLAGMVIALVMRTRRPDRYAGLGHFSLSDPILDDQPGTGATDDEEVTA
jgi:hypothetical protein